MEDAGEARVARGRRTSVGARAKGGGEGRGRRDTETDACSGAGYAMPWLGTVALGKGNEREAVGGFVGGVGSTHSCNGQLLPVLGAARVWLFTARV